MISSEFSKLINGTSNIEYSNIIFFEFAIIGLMEIDFKNIKEF